MAEMNIIDFLNKHNIQWQPINLDVVEGKKKLKYTNLWMPKPTDFKEFDEKTFDLRKKSINRFNHIAFDTRFIQNIDIDDENTDIDTYIDGQPYFLSTTKKLPHIFFKLENNTSTQRFEITKKNNGHSVEILNGQWSWAEKDTIVFNADADIKKINYVSYITNKKNIMPPHALIETITPPIETTETIDTNVKADFAKPQMILTELKK